VGICVSYSPREYENAVSYFKRAIELRPENPTPYHEAGRTLLNAGERFADQDSTLYTRAINYFHQAIERSYSPLSDVFRGLGTVYFRLGNYSESINCFEQAIGMLEEGDWVPDIFWLCAEAHRSLGNYEAAIMLYERYKECGLPDNEVDGIIKKLKVMEANRKKAK
jgi:tetratricopeptide (TPR) repeat protein